ncbi:MAG: 6-bladed beta-propeller [Balneolaceae bacterium]|nr:6-bladed beta-propeller [Balneolaceae bacterium]
MDRKIIFLFFLLFSSVNIVAQPSPAVETEFVLGDYSTLGNHSGDSLEYIFGDIRSFTTDSKGNIYVADASTQDIRKYNPKGKFISRIGRRGRGPGEFLELSYIFMSENKLYAADPMQFRISVFNLEGELLKTIITPKRSQVLNFFRKVEPYQSKNFIVFYKQWGAGKWAKFNKDEIFHVWNSDFSQELESFGSFEAFGYKDNFARLMAQSRLGSYVRENNTFIVAPYIYQGELLAFSWENNEWQLEKVKGNKLFLNNPAYEALTTDDGRDDTSYITSTYDGSYYGKINYKDAGLFTHDGYLIHFLLKKIKTGKTSYGWELGIEFFNSEFEHMGYTALRKFGYGELGRPPMIAHRDDNGYYYMRLRKNGAEVIEKFRLTLLE